MASMQAAIMIRQKCALRCTGHVEMQAEWLEYTLMRPKPGAAPGP